MSLFKSQTLGDKLDKEKASKERLQQARITRETEEAISKAGGLGNYISSENHSKVLIEQNECIIQLLSIICAGQNNISGTAAVAAMSIYRERLSKIKN